jgi:hypothetical protein
VGAYQPGRRTKNKRPIPSDSDKDVIYPAGTQVTVVEQLDKHTVVAEIRIPDDSLVGGARYDTILVKRDDLEV